MNLTPLPMLPRYFDVNKTPLVAIDCVTLRLRRYVGRECTNEGDLRGTEQCSGREIRDLIELFRESPRRAFAQYPTGAGDTDKVLA